MNETPKWPTSFRSKTPIEDPDVARKTWRNALWSTAASQIEGTEPFRARVTDDPRAVLHEMYQEAFPPVETTAPKQELRDHTHEWRDVTEDSNNPPLLRIEACECGAVKETGVWNPDLLKYTPKP